MHYEVALPPASSTKHGGHNGSHIDRETRLNSKSDKRKRITSSINAADNSYYTLTQPSELLLSLLHPDNVLADTHAHTITVNFC
uniref:Uncharacterized protein n=1 Tax=Glossina palpalis gambiensis TaxID=67801 RepID=A0A1B0AXL3_9MUSC